MKKKSPTYTHTVHLLTSDGHAPWPEQPVRMRRKANGQLVSAHEVVFPLSTEDCIITHAALTIIMPIDSKPMAVSPGTAVHFAAGKLTIGDA
jgi:hypothetical protein